MKSHLLLLDHNLSFQRFAQIDSQASLRCSNYRSAIFGTLQSRSRSSSRLLPTVSPYNSFTPFARPQISTLTLDSTSLIGTLRLHRDLLRSRKLRRVYSPISLSKSVCIAGKGLSSVRRQPLVDVEATPDYVRCYRLPKISFRERGRLNSVFTLSKSCRNQYLALAQRFAASFLDELDARSRLQLTRTSS